MVKVDDGIDIISRAKWKTFGKFIINHNELDNQKFKIRYLSGSQVPKLSNTTVSNEFSSLLSHLLDTKQINYELIKQLTDKEKTLFNNLMDLSGLKKQLNYKIQKTEPSLTDYKKRYNILHGEIEAGNNNKEVIEELKTVINKLVEKKGLSVSDANEMIKELNEIK
jgi:hypothetical protein